MAISDFEHKKSLYFRYRVRFGEDEIVRRLGLKDWEIKYFHGLLDYGDLDRRSKGQDKKQS